MKAINYNNKTITPAKAPQEAATHFARWMDRMRLTGREVSEQVGISRQYVYLLRVGAAAPGLELALALEVYTDGEVRPEHWIQDKRSESNGKGSNGEAGESAAR